MVLYIYIYIYVYTFLWPLSAVSTSGLDEAFSSSVAFVVVCDIVLNI